MAPITYASGLEIIYTVVPMDFLGKSAGHAEAIDPQIWSHQVHRISGQGVASIRNSGKSHLEFKILALKEGNSRVMSRLDATCQWNKSRFQL